jgi:hypothetical protein
MSSQDEQPAAPTPERPQPRDPTKVQTNDLKPGQEIKIQLDDKKIKM